MGSSRALACCLTTTLLALLSPEGAWGQGGTSTLSGRVIDATSRDPLPFVVVNLTIPGEAPRRVESDAEGRFRVENLPAQLIRLNFRVIGYQSLNRSLNLYAGRVSSVVYEMSHVQVILPEVVVEETAPTTVLMEGFAERRQQGFGTYWDITELDRMGGRNVADIVREAPGVRVVRSTTNETHAVTSRRLVGGPGRGPARECFMQVVVDGMIVWSPGPGGEVTSHTGPPPDIGRLLSTRELAGMEVYAGMSGVPLEYRREGVACGTVIFWTRRGSMRMPGI
ncbi:MAG: carboxypeptidase regulatory-like domain-containing protein [Gemmatimonadales bacterium]